LTVCTEVLEQAQRFTGGALDGEVFTTPEALGGIGIRRLCGECRDDSRLNRAIRDQRDTVARMRRR
jgi:hypothetical protein